MSCNIHSDETHWVAFALVCREITGQILLGAKTHFHTVQTSCALSGPSFSRKSSQRKQMLLSCNCITGVCGPAALNVASTSLWSEQEAAGWRLSDRSGGHQTGHIWSAVTCLTHVCWLRCWKIPGMSSKGLQKVLFCVVCGSSFTCQWVNVWLCVCDSTGMVMDAPAGLLSGEISRRSDAWKHWPHQGCNRLDFWKIL